MVIPAALVNSGSGEHFQVTRKRPRARASEREREGGRSLWLHYGNTWYMFTLFKGQYHARHRNSVFVVPINNSLIFKSALHKILSMRFLQFHMLLAKHFISKKKNRKRMKNVGEANYQNPDSKFLFIFLFIFILMLLLLFNFLNY